MNLVVHTGIEELDIGRVFEQNRRPFEALKKPLFWTATYNKQVEIHYPRAVDF